MLDFIKPTKLKVILSMFPIAFLFLVIPLWLSDSYELLNKFPGNILTGVSVASYWLFLVMSVPFETFLYSLDFMKNNNGLFLSFPEITKEGIFILTLFYIIITYCIFSILQYIAAKMKKD